MKKIYLPTYNELYQMQEMGANVYKYLFIKAIETLILEGIKYKNKGMLKSAYKYLKENPDIAQAICRLYPSEIQYSEIAKHDLDLCKHLITHESDKSIHNLDNLAHFSDLTLRNRDIIATTISLLDQKLPITPQYRFEYKENNLLDDIFNCNIEEYSVSRFSVEKLKDIEPAYLLKFSGNCFKPFIPFGKDESYLLEEAINKYARRYGIKNDLGKEYIRTDILTKPDQDVKRLIKCIKTQ